VIKQASSDTPTNNICVDPEAREPVYQQLTEPWAVSLDGDWDPRPPLKVALIPDRKLYREIFSLRIGMSVICLEPSLTFNWDYEYPCLSSEWDEGYERLSIGFGSWGKPRAHMILNAKARFSQGMEIQIPGN
jgi:hypothetical protein